MADFYRATVGDLTAGRPSIPPIREWIVMLRELSGETGPNG